MSIVRALASGLVLSALLPVPQAIHAAEERAAVAVVEGLHEALVDVAAMEPAPALVERTRLLAPVLRRAHDFTTMGRLTVRRFWRDWSESERARFVATFERFSLTTYASRFATIGPDTFEVLGSEAAGDGRVEVDAIIRRPDDEDVTMRYLLQLEEGDWRIVNVVADGASELSLMASDFYSILESGDLEDLLAELESRIAGLE